MVRRSSVFVVALAVMILEVAACGSSPPKGTIKGAGGVRYQWPPKETVGVASPSRFCSLLVDDYQHLKSISATMPTAQRAAVLRDFADFTPTLVAAAPAGIGPAASTYVGAEGKVLLAVVASGFNLATFDRSTLAALSSAPVVAAQSRLAGYASSQCHYSLTANSALAPKTTG